MKLLLIAACVLLPVVLLTGFSVAANELVIHKFGLRTDGKTPTGGLVADAMGNLYGVTLKGGGPVNVGTVYQLSPPTSPDDAWSETVLYAFTGNGTNGDGSLPLGDLAIDALGNLYGVTDTGGSANLGTVFELTPPTQTGGAWTETVLHGFTGLNDGAVPTAGLIFDSAGNLYGTTPSGGSGSKGVVFELSPPASPGGAWTETVLYAFQGKSDGSQPSSKLVFDAEGDLYGTTFAGGGHFNCNNGLIDCGTVFELSPPFQPGGSWTESVIHAFRGKDGQFPQAGLVIDRFGQLAGETVGGFNGLGVVYGLQPPPQTGGHWNFKILHSFTGQPSDGSGPGATLTLGVGGTLFGTTSTGGALGQGTVFQLSRAGCCNWIETGLYSFPGGQTGGVPAGGVLLLNGALYGTTSLGGLEDVGTAFKLTR